MERLNENVKPKFEVHPYEGPDVNEDGTVTRTHYKYESEKGEDDRIIKRGFVAYEVDEPAGFMVYLPSGASIRVRNETELKRLELIGESDLVDMETGEIIPRNEKVSLKEQSTRKTKSTRAKKFQEKLASKNSVEDMVEEIVDDE